MPCPPPEFTGARFAKGQKNSPWGRLSRNARTCAAGDCGGWSRSVSDCKFCKIDPAVAVDETPESLVFLDFRPVFPGHCLVIPKTHYETLLDLPAGLIQPL